MEGSFSVSTNNRFAFFMDEEDDPGDIIAEETKSDAKSKTKDPSSTTTQVSGTSKDDKTSPKNKKKQGGVKEKGQPADSNKRTDGGQSKKREPNPTNDRPPQRGGDKSGTTGGNDKPQRGFRDNRRNGPPNERNERNERGGGGGGSENFPPRAQGFRNRGRLPSREGQEGGQEDSSYNNSGGDQRSRPRWNNRGGDRQGGERSGPQGGGGGGDREGGERRFNPFRNRGGGAFRGGKREFERRSGSDKSSVKPIDKRDGGGAHNWGSVKDEMNTNDWPNEDNETSIVQDGEERAVPDTTEDTTADGSSEVKDKEETTEGEGKEQGEGGEEEEKEEPQLTLDEYKALQEKKRSVPTYKERRPGENEDQTRWKNTYMYERTEADLIPGTREIVEKFKTSGREKTVVESNFFFRDPQKFGGRGGGRGGANTGGPKREFGRFNDRRGDDDRRNNDRRGDDDRRSNDRRGDDDRRSNDRRGDDDRRSNDRRGNDRRGDDRRRGGRDDARGGGRPPRSTRDRSNFNVEDEKDFPSLGTVSA